MTDLFTMGRRDVLAGMSGLIGSATIAGHASAAVARGPASARSLMAECGYGDVTLLDSPARKQFDETLIALLAMDDDALLRPFRAAAGLSVGSNKLGGWYDAAAAFDPPRDMHGFIPGHTLGQYISALSRAYAVSRDARAKAKVNRLITGFAPTITPHFYKDYPLPAYTYDKTLIGLLDAYAFTGNEQALKLVGPATDAVLPYLPGKAQDRQLVKVPTGRNAAFGWDETYTLPENLYLAAERGAGDRFYGLARAYLLNDTYFGPLADGRNVLPGRHAYSHMNALASAMRAYMVDGNPRHLAAARNGMDFILDQSWATGGWGPNESFVAPGSGDLGKSLATSHYSFEAPCGTYGHFKVARYLMRATGESRYGDSMERLLYNASLGVLPLRPDGSAFYYADYSESGTKSYFEYNCPCCSGSIGQLTADYVLSAYLKDDKGLFVNLYIPSRVVWRRDDGRMLTLTQQGNYPLGSDIAMSVEAAQPTRMALRLRIPGWAGPGTRLFVNGRAINGVRPGQFTVLTREWRDGDKIALSIDRPLRLEAVDPQHPSRVAAVQGPLALFATGDRFVPLTRAQLMTLKQTAPGTAEWSLDADVGRLRFYPWEAVGTEATRLYQFLI